MKSLMRGFGVVALVLAASLVQAAKDVAMVMAVQGKVSQVLPEGAQPLKAFVKLKAGDALKLESGAQVQVLYFDNGQQESWSGAGKLQVGDAASRSNDLAAPTIKQVPLIMVKQMARTPVLDSQGRAGVVRLRAATFPDALSKLDETYRQMRAEAAPDDINPEIYLLAGLFEGKQLDRIEKTVAMLKEKYGERADVKSLTDLYEKAVKDARASAAAQ